MRILLLAIAIFITIHFLRVDFIEGTIPTNAKVIEQDSCPELKETKSIPVTSIEGDTIEALFALYPMPEISFIDRLEIFYVLNPHLQLQEIVSGDQILLPVSDETPNKCKEVVS